MGLARSGRMSALPDFSSHAVRRTGPAPATGERVWLLGGGGLLLLAVAAAFSAHHQLGMLQRAAEQHRADAKAARERVARVRAAQDPETLARAVHAQLTLSAPPPRVLRELQALMPGAVRLEQAGIDYGERVQVELRVAARSARDYDAFLERLGQAQAFQVTSTGPENRDGEVHATVRLRYATEAP